MRERGEGPSQEHALLEKRPLINENWRRLKWKNVLTSTLCNLYFYVYTWSIQNSTFLTEFSFWEWMYRAGGFLFWLIISCPRFEPLHVEWGGGRWLSDCHQPEQRSVYPLKLAQLSEKCVHCYLIKHILSWIKKSLLMLVGANLKCVVLAPLRLVSI
jgi:hypothetical protein